MLDLFNMILHIDQYMGEWVLQYGDWIYLVLFCIIFAETGLVVVPFLPGDSLLFIAGAFGASGMLDPVMLAGLLILAAVLGNTLNYHIGRYIGPKVFTSRVRFLDQRALLRTHVFYQKHGGKTIILSRFLPVIRTFAPFVAGVGLMNVVRFQIFNVVGAALWVAGLVVLGYFFGNVPIIKEHLNTIVLVGVSAAIVPVVFGFLWKLLRKKAPAAHD
jgi:membrane-associated protein